MGTPWDRAAEGYLEEWVPRFVPYHLDLVREMALRGGDRVLVTSAGPGAEVLAVARVVGDGGAVRATDKSVEMVRICREQTERARLGTPVEHAVADAADAGGGPWDAVLCAFGLWQVPERPEMLRAWAGALAPKGKVGLITWGPSDPGEPFQVLTACLHELEPSFAVPDPHVLAARDAMAAMFEGSGLTMVRHTVVRHTLAFASAEAFVRAMREGCTWRRIWEEVGDARMQRVAARFCERVGGPLAPLSFEPAATVAIAALPGAEVELQHRPSVRVPG
ncbi:MAG TPA: class I SAM-dependent methyltransferase [Polyangiaceae bacterium]|jgi:SAM-dependent methyltransferase|nr:class I SAM-dependent methyltransferase [Polyangiaceae bacterium]